jgi:hypothetical protein
MNVKVVRTNTKDSGDEGILVAPEELKELIKSGESQNLEFKSSAILSNTNELAIQMTAFANTTGGTMLIGVNDDQTIEGMSPRRGHQELIMNVATDRCDPSIRPAFETVTFQDNSAVYVIKISRSDGIHGVKFSGGNALYTRVGSVVRALTSADIAQKVKGPAIEHESPPADKIFQKSYRRMLIRAENANPLFTPSSEIDDWLYVNHPETLLFGDPHPRQHGVVFKIDEQIDEPFYAEVSDVGVIYYGETIPQDDGTNISVTIRVIRGMLVYATKVYQHFEYTGTIVVELKLGNVKGQQLTTGFLNTILLLRHQKYVTSEDEIIVSKRMGSSDLAKDPDSFVAPMTVEFLRAFGLAIKESDVRSLIANPNGPS